MNINSILITIAVIVILLAFLYGCGKFAKWFLFGNPPKDQLQQPLMSQMMYSDDSDSHAPIYSAPVYQQPSERIIEHYYQPVPRPSPPQPYYQPVYPESQNTAPVTPDEGRQPGQPDDSTPVYQPKPQQPRDVPYYQPMPAQPPSSQPVDDSDQEPARAMPDIPYYTPRQPAPQPTYQPGPSVDFYDNAPAPQAAQPVQNDWPFPEYTPAPIQPIAPPQVPIEDDDLYLHEMSGLLSEIPPSSLEPVTPQPGYPWHAEPPVYDPGFFVTPVLDSVPIEPGVFDIPEIFETPQASYPTLPTIVDADPYYTPEE